MKMGKLLNFTTSQNLKTTKKKMNKVCEDWKNQHWKVLDFKFKILRAKIVQFWEMKLLISFIGSFELQQYSDLLKMKTYILEMKFFSFFTLIPTMSLVRVPSSTFPPSRWDQDVQRCRPPTTLDDDLAIFHDDRANVSHHHVRDFARSFDWNDCCRTLDVQQISSHFDLRRCHQRHRIVRHLVLRGNHVCHSNDHATSHVLDWNDDNDCQSHRDHGSYGHDSSSDFSNMISNVNVGDVLAIWKKRWIKEFNSLL